MESPPPLYLPPLSISPPSSLYVHVNVCLSLILIMTYFCENNCKQSCNDTDDDHLLSLREECISDSPAYMYMYIQ